MYTKTTPKKAPTYLKTSKKIDKTVKFVNGSK